MKLSGILAIILVSCTPSNAIGEDLDGGPIFSGQTLLGTLDIPADRDIYRFEGNHGDWIFVDVRWTSRSTHHPQIALYPPGGSEHEAVGSKSLEHVLVEDGIYTIIINSVHDYTGEYNLTLQNLQDSSVSDEDPDGGAILSGQTLAGTLNIQSDMDAYRLEGSRDDRIFIEVKWTSRSTHHPQIVLYPPGGSEHEAVGSESLEHVLAEDGIYTIKIDSVHDYIGEYNLTFLNLQDSLVSDEDPDGGAILSGQTMAGTLNVQSDMDAYRFESNRDDRIFIDVRWTSRSTHHPQIVLYPPGGNEHEAVGSGSLEHVLAEDGIYTIKIDSVHDYTGDYNLTFENISIAHPSFVIYVDATISDPCENGTIEHPYDSIQKAIDIAREGASVLIRPGIYYGQGNRDLSLYGKAITIRSVDPNDPTVIRDTIIACQSNAEVPHRAFSFLHGEDSSSVLEGVTIESGYAEFGGAVFCKGSSPTIKGCIIKNCEAHEFGGAIYCDDSAVNIIGCQISRNKAKRRGGGIYLGANCSVIISNCTFTDNNAGESGGAVACELNFFGESLIQNSTIERNNASRNGGGIYCEDYHGLSILGCDIHSNKCRDQGGGVYIAQSQSETYVEGCVIADNSADQASGAFFKLEGIDSGVGIGSGVSIERNDWLVEGDGLLSANFGSDIMLNQATARIDCRIQGRCMIEVGVYSELHFEGDALVDLSEDDMSDETGHIICEGLLRLADRAKLENAYIQITRASFEDNAIIRNVVVKAEAGVPYGQFFVEGSATISGNDIHADGDRYMDMDRSAFDGLVKNNRIYVLITEGVGQTRGGLFELRGQDGLVGHACGADDFLCRVDPRTTPVSDPISWTLEELTLVDGAKLNLTNRFDFQAPYDSGGGQEVLYVKDLILGEGAVLNTAFNRIYYENLHATETAVIKNVPLLGFSLNMIALDDDIEFLTRVTHNNFEHPENLGYDRIHVEPVTGLEPDPNGMMRMCNLKEQDPNSPRYEEVINARAKGLFAKASEGQILVFFEYLFETSDPGAKLVIYLSDIPELLAHSDPSRADHYIEVALLGPPPPGRPGSEESSRFGVFQKTVSAGHLDFVRGVRIEFELIGPEGTCILINNWDPQIQCYGICKDVTWDNFVDTQDFLTVIREYGLGAGLSADGNSRACLEGTFSQDGYIDLHDVSGWDWTLNLDSRLNLCGKVPLSGESTALNAVSFKLPRRPLQLLNVPSVLRGLLIMGKGGAKNAHMKLEDQICILDHQGQYSGEFELPVNRGNTKLVMDPGGDLYQLSSEGGLIRLIGGDSVVPSGRLSLASDPRYDVSATVSVGLQGEGADVWGRPILDAAFDSEGYLYVVPVVVQPAGEEAYLAAAKLERKNNQTLPYNLIRLYDDSPLPGDNQERNSLREIEVDNDGNVYVTNANHLNESDILWVFDASGGVNSVGLAAHYGSVNIPVPVALCASRYDSRLYLASGKNSPDAITSVVYGLSTDTLGLAHSITINGMGHITDITEDPATGTLWVAGFTMQVIPEYPNPNEASFYQAYLAEIPHGGVGPVEAKPLPAASDMALPMSILWAGDQAGGAADFKLQSHPGLDVDIVALAGLAQSWLKPWLWLVRQRHGRAYEYPGRILWPYCS